MSCPSSELPVVLLRVLTLALSVLTPAIVLEAIACPVLEVAHAPCVAGDLAVHNLIVGRGDENADKLLVPYADP